jgi:hypothetical protein
MMLASPSPNPLLLAGEWAIVKRGKQAIREADARKGILKCLP